MEPEKLMDQVKLNLKRSDLHMYQISRAKWDMDERKKVYKKEKEVGRHTK